jgi:hypothetical protein
MRRAIDKWLKAGVLEDGQVSRPKGGTPQGGVISPILANIYLHHVLDVWFASEVQPRMHGTSMMVRYADDAVLVFASERDARRVMEVLAKRFAKYGLTLNATKTRLIDFRPPSSNGGASGSFDLLGLTHFWSRSRKGKFIVKRKTAKSRFARSVKAVWGWCRDHRHLPVRAQWVRLSAMLRGHNNYYGITGNSLALAAFLNTVKRIWRYWLGRRSQRPMTWDIYARLLQRYKLPPARAVHSIYAAKANLHT